MYAQESPGWDTATQDQNFEKMVTERVQFFSFLEKAIYVLIYPILFLAAKLVDNSLIYAETFDFDAVLRKLWNIMRNLANFWLWFLFIWKIFEYLKWGQKTDEIKKLLTSALIAWVWIQASRFALAALIDVSTILTYWVWWLPLAVLWDSSVRWERYDPHVLKMVIPVDVKKINDMSIYLTNTPQNVSGDSVKNNFYISECETFSYKIGEGTGNAVELILAPKYIYYQNENNEFFTTDKNRCHYYGQVYYFSKPLVDAPDCFATWCLTEQNKYDGLIKEIKAKTYTLSEMERYINDAKILEIWDANFTWQRVIWTKSYGSNKYWLDVGNEWLGDEETSRLHNLLDWKSYVWVFSSLYTSLLNAGRGIISLKDVDIYVSFLSILLSLWHLIAIAIPLIATAAVFAMRIGVIWMAIVLSPIIVLLTAFKSSGNESLMDKLIKSVKLLRHLKVENLIWIIFSPAVICFAVSMSTVLVRVIDKINFEDIRTNSTEILWWLIHLHLQGMSIWLWKLIIAIIWIAITWFIVWAAVQASSLWKWEVVKSIKDLATGAIGNAWVIPIPGKDWVSFAGYNSMKNALNKEKTNVLNTFRWWDNKAIHELLHPEDAAEKAEGIRENIQKTENIAKEKFNQYNNKLISLPVINDNWTEEDIEININWTTETMKFSNLTKPQQEEVIKSINAITDETKRSAFWQKQELTLRDNTTKYRFDPVEKQYKK